MRLHEAPQLEGAKKAECISAFASKNIFFLSLTFVYLHLAGVAGYWIPVITLNDTRTLGRAPLDEGSSCLRDL